MYNPLYQPGLPQPSYGFQTQPIISTGLPQPSYGFPTQPILPQPSYGFPTQPTFAMTPTQQPSFPLGGSLEMAQPIEEEPPTPKVIEESQRPTAYVSRIQGVEPSDVPPEVAEYRRLSREERALRMTNPRLLEVMAMRCTGCKKVVKQLPIENSLRSGKSLREVMDEQNYERICCRKQIQNEPVVVNIQKEMASEQSTINKMRNLSIASTAAALTGRGPIGVMTPSTGGIRILDEAPPGLVQEGMQIFGLSGDPTQQGGVYFTGLGESFLENRYQTGDAYEMQINQLGLDQNEEDEY